MKEDSERDILKAAARKTEVTSIACDESPETLTKRSTNKQRSNEEKNEASTDCVLKRNTSLQFCFKENVKTRHKSTSKRAPTTNKRKDETLPVLGVYDNHSRREREVLRVAEARELRLLQENASGSSRGSRRKQRSRRSEKK